MKQLRVTLRIRNNLLVQRREELALSQNEFAHGCGIAPETYARMERLQYVPLYRGGEWKKQAVAVAEYHGLSPDELWPDAVQAITEPVQTRLFDTGELRHALAASSSRLLSASPDEILEATETVDRIRRVVKTLTPREEMVLAKQFGIDEQDVISVKLLAENLGVVRTRANQIINHALRRLRHPSRRKIVDEPLPREPKDPLGKYTYPPWTEREGEYAKYGRTMSTVEREYWERVEKAKTLPKEVPVKQEQKRTTRGLPDWAWLEYAVRPLQPAHAFVLTWDGFNPTINDDQPSLCGKMVAHKNLPKGADGVTLRESRRERCERCCAILVASGKTP